MKSLTKSYAALLVLTVIGLILSGCGNGVSPLEVNSSLPDSNDQGMQFLSIGDASTSLKKPIIVSKFIEREHGGTITIDTEIGEVDVNISLKIEKKALPQDEEIVMSIDDQYFIGDFDVLFGPHGTQFAKPAKLNIKVKGLDLEGIDAKHLQLYYVNQESGMWEVMKTKDIKVDHKKNVLEVVDGQLPHFSRYALAYSR